MTEVVSYDLHDGVATLTMDDGKANALSLAMFARARRSCDVAPLEAKVTSRRLCPLQAQ
jgi:enoyl-CoA hydratase/carnithine racemase